MKKLLATIALSAACVSANASIYFWDANQLTMHLHGSPLSMQANGYLMGLAESADGRLYCMPIGITGGMLAEMMIYSMPRGTTGPHESMYKPAMDYVHAVLSKAYPCKR